MVYILQTWLLEHKGLEFLRCFLASEIARHFAISVCRVVPAELPLIGKIMAGLWEPTSRVEWNAPPEKVT